MNEAKIMKHVESPFIVKYFQSFVDRDKFYICMEYCSGGDLAQFLKGQMGKPLNEDTIWRFVLQIMLGLRHLHSKKILHRDIKTMNVFLADSKSIRIGDLGVARTMTGDFASTIVGTPYYLSPEMCEEKPYNEKTDVWAMGCLVYELCTGRHPFEANSQAALALKIVVGKYSPIPSHYSQTLAWLIRLCLSVDYKRRPSI
jgi:NIMA (never in mitosis gene a)-related kinase